MAALGFDIQLIIIYTIQFAIVFFLLRMLAYQPIANMLEKRKQTIAEGLAAAEKAQQEAAKQREAFEEELKKAQLVAQSQAQEQAEATKKLRDDIIRKAEEEAQQIKARAEADANQMRQQVSADLQKEAVSLAMQMTRKIVGEGIDQNTQRKLTEQFLANLGDA